MEYITVNRARYSRKPTDQEQARQDLIDFIVGEIFEGNRKARRDTKSFARNLHNDEIPSYLASLRANCAAAKAELAKQTDCGYFKKRLIHKLCK